MGSDLPAITGSQLIKLLQKDGWKPGRKAKHGRCLTKRMPSRRTRVTFVPEMRASLPDGTLSAILSERNRQELAKTDCAGSSRGMVLSKVVCSELWETQTLSSIARTRQPNSDGMKRNTKQADGLFN